jgi:hypothetical protein
MLDPSLFINSIPELDEALPVDVYAELTNTTVETVIDAIEARRLLGVLHQGVWYAEAPAFGEDKLRRIWGARGAKTNEKQYQRQEEARQQNHQDTSPPQTEARSDLRYARVLGLNGRVTRDDVKRRWRELTVQYHPDKVAHLGPKLREVAEHEMKAINEAYDYFRSKYQI